MKTPLIALLLFLASAVSAFAANTLTLPSTTTAYSANQLIANNATATSIIVPAFTIAGSPQGVAIPRVRLSTNDSTSTAWGGQTIQVDLWSVAPTWNNGDRGTWSVLTGTGHHLASYTCVMSSEQSDGAFAECSIASGEGTFAFPSLPGTSVYWTLEAITGSGVTGASKVFTLYPEVMY